MGSFTKYCGVISSKNMKTATVFGLLAIAIVSGKPQPPFLFDGPVGPFGGPENFLYGLPVGPVCPEEVCTGCAEEGATDLKTILAINCRGGLEDCHEGLEDCHAGVKDCAADAEDCSEPLKDCGKLCLDPTADECTKECLIGPGPCIRENRKKVGKCVADQSEEVGKCLQEQRETVGKCVSEKKMALAKAEECLACAGSCKKDEE